MAKFTKADDEIQDMVHDIASDLGLENFIDFEALYVAKAHDVIQVVKASQIAQYYAKRDDLVLLFIYADAFDAVDKDTQKMWLKMAMDTVSYDSEKDKVNIGTAMITVPYGFYLKYKQAAIDASELALVTMKQIEDKKQQEKEEKKGKKKSKKEN